VVNMAKKRKKKKESFPEVRKKHRGKIRLGIMIGEKFCPYDKRTWAWKHRKKLEKMEREDINIIDWWGL